MPPTRIWGNGPAPMLTAREAMAGQATSRRSAASDLVRRYLAAYGPASINDMQTWCRLTKLSPEFEALEEELVVLRGRGWAGAVRPARRAAARCRYAGAGAVPAALRQCLSRLRQSPPHAPEKATLKRINLFADFNAGGADRRGDRSGLGRSSRKKGAARLEIEPYRKLTQERGARGRGRGRGVPPVHGGGRESQTIEVEALPLLSP